MRLEAMVIRRVDEHAAGTRGALQFGDVLVASGPQRLFDEHVLAVLDAVANEVELRLVRNAGEDGVVAIKRDVAQALVVGVLADRIDRTNVIAGRKALPLAALNAHS